MNQALLYIHALLGHFCLIQCRQREVGPVLGGGGGHPASRHQPETQKQQSGVREGPGGEGMLGSSIRHPWRTVRAAQGAEDVEDGEAPPT